MGGAWINSLFRNERRDLHLSSDLIREACAATRAHWGDPPEPHGLVTFIDAGKTKHKRDPGRCYLRAGFTRCGFTKGGLVAVQLRPADFPPPMPALGEQQGLFLEAQNEKSPPDPPKRVGGLGR